MRTAERIENIINTQGDMLFRLCLITLGNSHDAEDAVQETFIKYLKKAPEFKSDEHEKAWLITVATNKCKDIIRAKNHQPQINIDDVNEFTADSTNSDIMEALMTLPEKFKTVLILHYIEGYSTKEIARIINRTTSAVKMRLQKGRSLLKETYRKELM
ncbi:MAG: RNA polymerase sigma factor [Ruminococcus sp.]|nr:RNA polymerase sigma factor [Ruminococcus sp.]